MEDPDQREPGGYRFADDPLVQLAETALAVGAALVVAGWVPLLRWPAVAVAVAVAAAWGRPALRRLEAELAADDTWDDDERWGVAGWPAPRLSEREKGRLLAEQTERWLAAQQPPPPDIDRP